MAVTVQSAPQSMPGGELVTVPEPAPDFRAREPSFVTVGAGLASLKGPAETAPDPRS